MNKFSLSLSFPQYPIGSASRLRFYFRSRRAAIDLNTPVGPVRIASSGRLLSWKSGNWSSRAKPVVKNYEEYLADLEKELQKIGERAFVEEYTVSRQSNGRRVRDYLALRSVGLA